MYTFPYLSELPYPSSARAFPSLHDCPYTHRLQYFVWLSKECIDEEDDATDDTNENERQDSGVGKTDESTRNEESSEQVSSLAGKCQLREIARSWTGVYRKFLLMSLWAD